MEAIGVRALRQNASAVLKRVEAGESIEVTDRGRPVARLVPVQQDVRASLEWAGRHTRASGDLLDLGAPIRLSAFQGTPSKRLRAMRNAER